MSGAPTIADQIEVVEATIATLRDSFVDRIGPTAGQITEPGIVREIECLEATLALLRAQSGEGAASTGARVCGRCGCTNPPDHLKCDECGLDLTVEGLSS
ncbi:MAG: hypothetical protein ABMA13_23045 [Chthoniobacteraceae bacterium]